MAVCKHCGKEMLGSDSCLEPNDPSVIPPKELLRESDYGRVSVLKELSGTEKPLPHCHDCGVAPGGTHHPGCDVERCGVCGGQAISCGCCLDENDEPNENEALYQERRVQNRWTGVWPGTLECRAKGYYAKLVPGRGWVQCDKDDPEASEDLNRLAMEQP